MLTQLYVSCTDTPTYTINFLWKSSMLLEKTEPDEKVLSNHINSNSKKLDLIFRLIYNNLGREQTLKN